MLSFQESSSRQAMSNKKENGEQKVVHHITRTRVGTKYLGSFEVKEHDKNTITTVAQLHESERNGVIQLIGHLNNAEGVPINVDLTKANPVLLWYVQKVKIDSKTRYQMWTPRNRSDVRWAMGPPQYVLARAEAIDMLKEWWIADAAKWLKETSRGKLS
jgi:hypothetical protein